MIANETVLPSCRARCCVERRHSEYWGPLLVDLFLKELSDPEIARVQYHLLVCAACRKRIAMIEQAWSQL